MKKIIGRILGIIPKLLIVLFIIIFLIVGYNRLNPQKVIDTPINQGVVTIENNTYKEIEKVAPAIKDVPKIRKQVSDNIETVGSHAIENWNKVTVEPKSRANQNLFDNNNSSSAQGGYLEPINSAFKNMQETISAQIATINTNIENFFKTAK